MKLWLETAVCNTAVAGLFISLFAFAEDCFMQWVLSFFLSRFTLKFEIDGLPTISPKQVFFAMNLLNKLLWSSYLTSGITLAVSVLAESSDVRNLPFCLLGENEVCVTTDVGYLFILRAVILNWRKKGRKSRLLLCNLSSSEAMTDGRTAVRGTGAVIFAHHIAVLFAFSMSLKIQYLNNTFRESSWNPKGLTCLKRGDSEMFRLACLPSGGFHVTLWLLSNTSM